MRGGREQAIVRLDEGERMVFWIFEGETRRAGFVFSDGAGVNFVSEKIFTHLGEVRSGESNFGEEIVGYAAGDLLEFDTLAAANGETGIGDAKTSGSGGIEAEDFGVEGARGVEVCSVKADGGNAGDFRTGLCGAVRGFFNTEDRESTEKKNSRGSHHGLG